MTKHPTSKTKWVRVADRVQSRAGMFGVVERITDTGTLPYATVLWDNGVRGRVSITNLTLESDRGVLAARLSEAEELLRGVIFRPNDAWKSRVDLFLARSGIKHERHQP